MPVSWKQIEDAIRAWVRTSSGFADQSVIWRNENGNARTENYIDITLLGMIPIGLDALTDNTDLARPSGQEIELRVEGDREFGISIECFTTRTTESTGETTARSVLSRVQIALGLPSIREALAAADLSPFDIGTIQWLPAVGAKPNDTSFAGRAILEVRFYVRDDMAERVGYIKTVEITDLATGNMITIDSP